MNRRNFIILSATGAMIATLPLLECRGSDQQGYAELSIPIVLSRITDKNTILQIGKTFGEMHPEQYTLSDLEKKLKTNLPADNTLSDSLSKTKINALIGEQIFREFSQTETLVIRGWVITLTEARQCALFSLLESKNQ